MELNHSTPIVHCWVRNEFLFDQLCGKGEFTEGYIFGVSSLKARALGFNVMLKTGAHFRWLPTHALAHNIPVCEDLEQYDLQIWDCFSNSISVIEWEYLKAHECSVLLGNKMVMKGVYVFTVDWLPDAFNTSFVTEPEQNKCAHVIALENGQFAVMPTNRILWRDGYFIGPDPQAHKMGYKTCTTAWRAEGCDMFSAAKSSEVFYESGTE